MKIKTTGTGKAGHKSARWMRREDAKRGARKARRAEDRKAAKGGE